MALWLDASVVVSLLTRETTSPLVDEALQHETEVPLISDFCVAECSSAVARLARTRKQTAASAAHLFQELDAWTSSVSRLIGTESIDIENATILVRRTDLALRTPDAIHIAAAHRLGATILTLDRGMARAAAALGVPYLNPAEADAPGEPKD